MNSSSELRKALVNYRVKCDMAYSELNDGFYSPAEYKKAIQWEEDNFIALIAQSNQELLKRIELPEKLGSVWTDVDGKNPELEADDDFEKGYNKALQDCQAIINAIRESI